MAGFEPTAPRSQSECSNQAELHSGNIKEINVFAITSLTLTRFISKICLAINSIETIGWIAFFLDFFFLRGSGGGKCVYVHKTSPWFRPIHIVDMG